MEHNNPSKTFEQRKFNQTSESSMRDADRERFSIDKSIIQGVMEKNSNKIISRTEDGGNVDGVQDYNELDEISAIIIEKRKHFDEERIKAQKTQQEIDRLKKLLESLEHEKTGLDEAANKIKQSVASAEESLSKINVSLDWMVYNGEVCTNSQDRLKHDILFYKKRYFDKEITLNRQKHRLKSLRQENLNKTKMSLRCRQILQSVEQTANDKVTERTGKLEMIETVLSRKRANSHKRAEREVKVGEVVMSAMTDKLQEEQEWMKMFLVNRFVKGMLRCKMGRMISHYQEIQMAYHKIKQHTSVVDCGDLITKFVNRQQNYGTLLESICESEKKLGVLKVERQKLQEDNKTLTYDFDLLQQAAKKPSSILSEQKQLSTMNKLDDEIKVIYRLKELMYNWGVKYIGNFQDDKSRNEVIKCYSRDKLKELLIHGLTVTLRFLDSQNLEKMAETDRKSLKSNGSSTRVFTQQMEERNTRIRTMSYIDDFQEVTEDQQQPFSQEQISEREYLHFNRRLVKKNDVRRFRIKTKVN